MYCPACGKQINDNSKFCRYCGNPVMLNLQENKSIQHKNTISQTYRPANDINTTAINIATAALKSKSMVASFLLSLLFGPLGLLYSTVSGGLLMIIAMIFVFFNMWGSLGSFVAGIGFFFLVNLICIVWGLIAVHIHNNKLLEAAQGNR